jgi:hypothetical protein
MIITIEKKYNKKEIDKLIEECQPVKVFDAKKIEGTIKWDEDPVKYQRQIRNEWD